MSWYATHVDRGYDPKDGLYGEGIPRLYHKGQFDYKLIKGVSYDKEKNVLIVEDKTGKQYKLDKEPDNECFDKTTYSYWKEFDEIYGAFYMDDRSDYEPWAYDSIKSLAIELKLHSESDIIKFYRKSFRA
jgi:hypothetical protein